MLHSSQTLRLAAVLAMSIAQAAPAANCALRQPRRQIEQIFPDFTSIKSVDAAVDKELKAEIEAVLGSELSISDVGKHTAYIVLRKGVPIGIVHARTETGSRGTIELVWAMDLDMRIKDFRVQGSREKHTDVIKSDAFRNKLVGRDLGELRRLLTAGNDDVDIAALEVPASARKIAHDAVLCGVKTRIITDEAFAKTILPARAMGLVHRYFPTTARITRIATPYPDGAADAMTPAGGGAPGQVDRNTFVILRAFDATGAPLGVLALAHWTAHAARPETWWAVGPEGTIRETLVVGNVDAATRAEFADLRGADLATLTADARLRDTGLLANSRSPADTPAHCGVEVLTVMATHDTSAPPPPQ